MELKLKWFKELSGEEVYRLMQARSEVFFLEQQITVEDADGIDLQALHLWLEEAGEVVALLRILPPEVTEDGFPSIGRLLVRRPWRRRGLCRRMMLEAIDCVQRNWPQLEIHISAQRYLVDFYGELGFEITSDIYLEAGIEHQSMRMAAKC
ncbi:MAG: GNAT family N-acetyltransferase [Alistipes sp.]|nr:GNAT family N-acetyltransferase [Alistipes sp.]